MVDWLAVGERDGDDNGGENMLWEAGVTDVPTLHYELKPSSRWFSCLAKV